MCLSINILYKYKRKERGKIFRIVYFSRRRLAKFCLVTIILCCTLGVFHQSLFEQANETISVLVQKQELKPIYFVDTKEKKVSLSFDAAWGAEYTPKLLEILEKHKVKTTFFLTNIWLEDYPEVAKLIASKGHEIGMHSVTHPHMNSLSDAQILEELQGNAKMITDITGFKPKVFRPPFGEYNDKVINVINNAGFYPIQWSIDSLDWKNDSKEQDIIDRITKKIHPGAIILCHNNGRYTAEALEEVVEYILKEGYKIVPVSELIYKDNYYVDIQGAQKLK